MAIAENTTHYLAMNGEMVDYGRTINQRWMDLLNPPPPPEPEDDRPSEEIAADIFKRIRGH